MDERLQIRIRVKGRALLKICFRMPFVRMRFIARDRKVAYPTFLYFFVQMRTMARASQMKPAFPRSVMDSRKSVSFGVRMKS